MNSRLVSISIAVFLLLVFVVPSSTARTKMSRNPYAGAIVIDAATGKVLFNNNADTRAYPASITKLMVLLVLLEAVESRRLTLDEPVTVTAASARIGGSQVYLKEHEVFPVDDLLYALVVRSANDAATALAIHFAGSKTAFVELMNARAREIGMNNTVFHSVHGLPPGRGQLPDVSTPRDIAKLCRELLKHPQALKYTSTKKRLFRTDAKEPFVMLNHNPLLKRVKGCDGFKTGFFNAAGFSIAATAARDGHRAIAVVLGAEYQRIRDAKAQEMLTRGLAKLATDAGSPASVPVSGAGR